MEAEAAARGTSINYVYSVGEGVVIPGAKVGFMVGCAQWGVSKIMTVSLTSPMAGPQARRPSGRRSDIVAR